MTFILAQAEALTKAANDVIAAQDMLSIWKAIAILGWLAAAAAFWKWQAAQAAERERLQKLVDTYQAGKGDTR